MIKPALNSIFFAIARKRKRFVQEHTITFQQQFCLKVTVGRKVKLKLKLTMKLKLKLKLNATVAVAVAATVCSYSYSCS